MQKIVSWSTWIHVPPCRAGSRRRATGDREVLGAARWFRGRCLSPVACGDQLEGGAGNDVIVGGGADDISSGGIGNDTIFGDGGDDTLDGGPGIDPLVGGNGHDIIHGGAANDELWQDGGGVDVHDLNGGGNDCCAPAGDQCEVNLPDCPDKPLEPAEPTS